MSRLFRTVSRRHRPGGRLMTGTPSDKPSTATHRPVPSCAIWKRMLCVVASWQPRLRSVPRPPSCVRRELSHTESGHLSWRSQPLRTARISSNHWKRDPTGMNLSHQATRNSCVTGRLSASKLPESVGRNCSVSIAGAVRASCKRCAYVWALGLVLTRGASSPYQ